jgi:hypothetical protein
MHNLAAEDRIALPPLFGERLGRAVQTTVTGADGILLRPRF